MEHASLLGWFKPKVSAHRLQMLLGMIDLGTTSHDQSKDTLNLAWHKCHAIGFLQPKEGRSPS